MKKLIIFNHLLLGVLTGITFLSVGCAQKPVQQTAPPLIIHVNDFKSGQSMIDSLVRFSVGVKTITGITQFGRWSDTLYKEIDHQISVAYSFKKMSENQMIKLYDALLDRSSNYSLQAVQYIMKQTVVRDADVKKYTDMNKFLSKEFKDKHAMNNLIMQKSQFLNKSIDMLSEYQKVKNKSATSFQKQVKLYNGYGERYCYASCADIEHSMKNSKYWTEYFSNNSSFKTAITQFPDRRKKAINRYYEELFSIYKTEFDQGVMLQDETIDLNAITQEQANRGYDFIDWATADGANQVAGDMSSYLDSKAIK